MVEHTHRERSGEPRRHHRTSGDEHDDEDALRELQQQAGNRAIAEAADPARTSSHERPVQAGPMDSPGLRVLAALQAGRAGVQRQAATAARMLRRGMAGADVSALQADLARAGHGLAVDGIFGPRTQAAVVAFQRAAGLAADGVVGPATRGALGAAAVAGVDKGGTDKAGTEKGKEPGGVATVPWAPGTDETGTQWKAWGPGPGKAEGGTNAGSEKATGGVAKEAWAPEGGSAGPKVTGVDEAAKAGAGAAEEAAKEAAAPYVEAADAPEKFWWT